MNITNYDKSLGQQIRTFMNLLIHQVNTGHCDGCSGSVKDDQGS